MDFKRYVIKYRPDISLPVGQKMAATPVESIAPDDVEVEILVLLCLQAQGKLISIEEVLAEFKNDAD